MAIFDKDPRLESKDWIVILAGFLGALKIFLASLPEPYAIRIEDDTLSSLINMVAFGVVLWGVIWGNYSARKEAKQLKIQVEQEKPQIIVPQDEDKGF